MTITTTGIGFLLFSLGFAFCGFRFSGAFQKDAHQKIKSKIAILISTIFFSNAIAIGILTVGILFFAQNSETLYRFLVVSYVPLTFAAMVGMYAVFYILLPLISPWPGVITVSILGVNLIILTILTHPQPFIDASGGIDWNMIPVLSASLCYLVFVNLGTQFVIFLHSFFQTKSREVKVISFAIIAISLMGIINMFIHFLFPVITNDFLRTRIFDIMFAVMGLIFIIIFLPPPMVIKWFSRIKNQ